MLQELHERQKSPLIIVISGPSGVGKDSVLEEMKSRDLPFHFVVTATTRPIREGEIEGQDYFFVSRDQFAEMIENDQLIEYAIVYDDYKGIPRQQVEGALASGKDVVMRLDVQGAETIRKLYPEAVLIFLSTRDEAELEERLISRETETPDNLKIRIATARQELRRVEKFDYYVINADQELAQTADVVLSIIVAEHHRTRPRKVIL